MLVFSTWVMKEMYIYDFFHCLFTGYVVERSLTNHKFVSQDSQTPKIHCHVVLNAFQYLGSCIIECSTIGFSSLVTNCSPPKIAKLTHTMRYYNILRLYISMRNSVLMEIFNNHPSGINPSKNGNKFLDS